MVKISSSSPNAMKLASYLACQLLDTKQYIDFPTSVLLAASAVRLPKSKLTTAISLASSSAAFPVVSASRAAWVSGLPICEQKL